MQSKTTPVNRNTESQSTQKAYINILQNEWLKLTSGQRNCWKNYASLFPIKQNNFSGLVINAQQTFIRLNVPFLQYGHPIITNPVLSPSTLPPIVFNPSRAGPGMKLFISRASIPLEEFYVLYATYPTSHGINNAGSIYKLNIFETSGALFVPWTISYTNVFGIQAVVGTKVFWKVFAVDLVNGQQLFRQEGFTIMP